MKTYRLSVLGTKRIFLCSLNITKLIINKLTREYEISFSSLKVFSCWNVSAWLVKLTRSISQWMPWSSSWTKPSTPSKTCKTTAWVWRKRSPSRKTASSLTGKSVSLSETDFLHVLNCKVISSHFVFLIHIQILNLQRMFECINDLNDCNISNVYDLQIPIEIYLFCIRLILSHLYPYTKCYKTSRLVNLYLIFRIDFLKNIHKILLKYVIRTFFFCAICFS